MDVREPFSKLKEKLKHRLTGRKRQPSEAEADSDGERAGPAGSLPQPGPNVVVGGDGEDPPQPSEPGSVLGFVPAAESENDRGGDKVRIDGREVSQRPYTHPNVEVTTGSGPNREGGDIDGEKVEQPSVPPIPRSGEPDST